jgi:acyl dehydratase
MSSSAEPTHRSASPDIAGLQAMIGREGPTFEGPDAVNAAMIRHWCAAMGDRNPVYTQAPLAAASRWKGVIAPPAMLQAWVMPGFGVPPLEHDPIAEFHRRSTALGYSSIVATNCEQEYLRPLRLGERVRVRKRIEGVSGEKRTALGPGVFLTTLFSFTDGEGQEVARMLHRVLKFKPGRGQPARDAGTITPLLRPRTDLPVLFSGSERAIGWPGAAAAALPRTVLPGEVFVGAKLARLEIPLTRSYIVASAIATRDYEEIHHDPDLARERGSQDIFLNILTTSGLVGRFATDAFGPDAELRKLAIRLGATAYPGDTLAIDGEVIGRADTPAGCELRISVRGTVGRGEHVSGELTLRLGGAP